MSAVKQLSQGYAVYRIKYTNLRFAADFWLINHSVDKVLLKHVG